MYNFLTEIKTEPWSWPWWGIMVGINVISILIFISLLFLTIKDNKKHPEDKKYRITLMVFGAIYVTVAMYRSIFVSKYTNQLAWFDTLANSSFVIRSFATFAEISFSFLVALPLIHLNKQIEFPERIKNMKGFSKYLIISPYITIVCLCVAQFFAWSGLFTQYHILFTIEETLWSLGFTAILPLVIVQLNNLFKNYKNERKVNLYKTSLLVLAIFTVGYLAYQYAYQLPFNYYGELANDFANGVHYGFDLESLKRILFEYHPTRSYEEWGGIGFFSWHSGYFSICVWMSILFAYGPRIIEEK